ncbi:hypothetical protein [Pseudomonas sp. NPDC088444]|uniref:hypothetical protein n=1 Tax=Pseudomonas sp. NPDC088444 TaxID=3364456 RepID=UPI00384DFDF0
MTVVKTLNLTSYALQLLALLLATRIDLKALALSRAEEDLPANYLVEVYESARDGKPRTESEEEKKYHKLDGENDAKRYGSLIRWAAALIAISIALQGAATLMTPD